MTISAARTDAPDHAPCRYNGSRLWFRGPRRSLKGAYVCCLGGSETYGRFVGKPFSDLLEHRLGFPVVNLGVLNGGPDAYLNDPGALQTAANADQVVIQLCNIANLSNRLYSVHPRRNDRFIKASPGLQALYPEMDFTEVHFTQHLLTRLYRISPERFANVVIEIRAAWQARMRQLLSHLRGEPVFLWFARTPLPKELADRDIEALCLADRRLLDPLEAHVRALVAVVPQDWNAGRDAMTVSDFEADVASLVPAPPAHVQAAQDLSEVLQQWRSRKC